MYLLFRPAHELIRGLGRKNVRQMVLTIFEPLHNFINFPHFPDFRQPLRYFICYLCKICPMIPVSRFFVRLSWITLIFIYLVIIAGSFVRITGWNGVSRLAEMFWTMGAANRNW
jgi:hypothetical protein